MSENYIQETDKYLNSIKAARDADAVLKMELISVKSDLPGRLIFVFEGDEDKIVYFNWINRISTGIVYEPLPMRGKKRVLRLRNAAIRDRGDLLAGVHFFIDRDFDDWAGFGAHESTFITESYSVENYLVSPDVLRQFLINEFHCHGRPILRERIITDFTKLYNDFLEETKDVNHRIFLARKLGLNAANLPEKLGTFVEFDLSSVRKKYDNIVTVVKVDREPDITEIGDLNREFEALDRPMRYRGKYCYRFFDRWLHELGKDYNSPTSTYFSDLDRTSNAKLQEITLGSMASKSAIPDGLERFIAAVPALPDQI